MKSEELWLTGLISVQGAITEVPTVFEVQVSSDSDAKGR